MTLHELGSHGEFPVVSDHGLVVLLPVKPAGRPVRRECRYGARAIEGLLFLSEDTKVYGLGKIIAAPKKVRKDLSNKISAVSSFLAKFAHQIDTSLRVQTLSSGEERFS